MAVLNQISHPNKLVQIKVNFFADYYNFVTNNIGLFDDLEIENPLSLIEKCIYQIIYNLEHCPKYLDCYFSHPLLNKRNRYLNEFKEFQNLLLLIQSYFRAGNSAKKIKWIKDSTQFISSLTKLKKELDQEMFNSSLKAIISFLKCEHKLNKHKEDIIFFTHILINEFMLNNRAKKDVSKVFERIMTSETSQFPYPKSLIELHKGEELEKSKIEFIQNRTFDQQFEGIYNIFKEKERKHYFLFRVFGISATPDFIYKYNRVTFYHPEHKKFKGFRKSNTIDRLLSEFFNQKSSLIASVRINYYSSEIAEKEAINTIKSELEFLNHVCGANAQLEKFSFLVTEDFKSFGGRRSAYENGRIISEVNKVRLEDNPFNFLNRINTELSNHFLKYEPLFIRAITSNNMPDYWHYLEILLPTKNNNEQQIIEIVSSMLLLNSEKYNKTRLQNYIEKAFFPLEASADILGISKERQLEFFKMFGGENEIDFKEFAIEITHPLLTYLFKIHSIPFKKPKLVKLKEYYSRVFLELKAQRNAIVHYGFGNENALILLNGTIPHLISRFRWVLFDGMEKKKGNSFEELISNLKKEADALIN